MRVSLYGRHRRMAITAVMTMTRILGFLVAEIVGFYIRCPSRIGFHDRFRLGHMWHREFRGIVVGPVHRLERRQGSMLEPVHRDCTSRSPVRYISAPELQMGLHAL